MRAEGESARLLAAKHARHQLARGLRAVPLFRWSNAVVAIAAGAAGFTKVVEQGNAATFGRFTQSQDRIQLHRGDALVVGVRLRLIDHPTLLNDVRETVDHPRIGRHAVSTRPACFLIVALDTFGQIQVSNEAHVRLIDPHTECDSRDHDYAILTNEPTLMHLARAVVQAGVIWQRIYAVFREEARCLIDRSSSQAINDAGLAGMLAPDEFEQLLSRAVFLCDPIADIRSVEAGNEDAGSAQPQFIDDLRSGRHVRGRGERNSRDLGITLGQDGQTNVLGTEIVAPLRHAVRLVNRE